MVMRRLIYIFVLLAYFSVVGCNKEDPLDTSKGKQVNISFDDGVSLESLYDNLDIFETYNAKITYYVSNINLVLNSPEKLEGIISAGHEIGVHGYNHFPAEDYVEDYGMEQWLSEEVLQIVLAFKLQHTPTLMALAQMKQT
jgi:peptidoglycan/xylan/chitin deacetylase (PgdA/CDA1 family)